MAVVMVVVVKEVPVVEIEVTMLGIWGFCVR